MLIIELKALNTKIDSLDKTMQDLPENLNLPKTINLKPHIELPEDVFTHTQIKEFIETTDTSNKLIRSQLEKYEKQIKAFKDEITREKTQKVSLDSNEVKITNTDDLKVKEVAIKQADEIIKAIKSIKLKYPEAMKVYQEPYTYTITRDIEGRIIRETKVYKDKTIIESIQRDRNGRIIGGKVEVK
jgi:hypothetical protein